MVKEPTFPQSLEAERAVLGGMLSDSELIPNMADVLAAEDFYSPAHEEIYRWLVDRYTLGKPADVLVLVDHALAHNLTDKWGDVSYLCALPEQCPSTVNLVYYARIISEKAARRKVIMRAAQAEQAAFHEQDEDLREAVLAEAEAMTEAVKPKQGSPIRALAEVARVAGDRARAMLEGDVTAEFIPTGFPTLDDRYTGWIRGYPTVIGGRPKMGKTMFLLSAVLRGALLGYPQGIVSIEMPAEKLAYRLANTLSGVSWKPGRMDDHEAGRWLDVMDNGMKDLPVFIDDAARKPIQVVHAIRTLARRHGCKVIYLDYFQLITAKVSSDGEGATAVLDGISDALRAVCKEEGVALVVFAQFNRKVEERITDGRKGVPAPTDFRGTDRLLMDAGLCASIYREFAYHPPPHPTERRPYTDRELARLLQPLEFRVMASREEAPSNVELYIEMATGQVHDPLDPGFEAPEWEGRVGGARKRSL